MRPMTSLALHAVLAAALAAFAATSAAAGGTYLKLGNVDGNADDRIGHGGGQIEVESVAWGAAQLGSADLGSWAKADGLEVAWDKRRAARGANQISMDDTAGNEKLQPGGGGAGAAQKDMILKGKSIAQNSRDPGGSGQWIADVEKPASGKGTVWIRVSSPWAHCRVGDRYPAGELATANGRYQLKDVIVSGCAANAVALDYARVAVRGWDPRSTKQ